MENNTCPLCFKHIIAKEDKIDGFFVEEFKVFIPQVALLACPAIVQELQPECLLTTEEVIPGFTLSIYRIRESLRFVFQRTERSSVSYLYSPDEAITILDDLKNFCLTIYLNKFPRQMPNLGTEQIVNWKQLLLKVMNERFKPAYTAIRNFRDSQSR